MSVWHAPDYWLQAELAVSRCPHCHHLGSPPSRYLLVRLGRWVFPPRACAAEVCGDWCGCSSLLHSGRG